MIALPREKADGAARLIVAIMGRPDKPGDGDQRKD
jgi:hypothetical protein